jgi:hypothetical protein
MERMLVHLLGSFFFTIWSRLEQKPTEQRSQINISRVQSTSWSIFYAVKDCGFHICCIMVRNLWPHGACICETWRVLLASGFIATRNAHETRRQELYATTPLFIHETSKSQTLIFVAGFGLSHWGIVNRLRVLFSDQFLNINIDFFDFFFNERSSMSRSNLKDHMGVNLTHSLPTGLNLQNTNLGSISNSLPIILWLLDRLHSCMLSCYILISWLLAKNFSNHVIQYNANYYYDHDSIF